MDTKFNFVNDMVAHKESDRKVVAYEGNCCIAIELALVRGILIVFAYDNYVLACCSPIGFPDVHR